MSEKEDQGDLTENTEYEDDFEKELECLTDDEEKKVFGTLNASCVIQKTKLSNIWSNRHKFSIA